MDKANIASIYPLSANQQIFLAHSLQHGTADAGVLQVEGRLQGPLDVERFSTAWQRVVDRHPVLRSAVHWEGLDKPLQVVLKHVDAAMVFDDVSAAPDPPAAWRAVVDADRHRGLDLATAPSTRLTVARVGDGAHCLLWSCHHVLIDGWSGAIVLGELLAVYDSLVGGRPLEMPRPRRFADYLVWLERQDAAQAESYWQRVLDGWPGDTPMPVAAPTAAPPGQHVAEIELDPARTTAIVEAARRWRVTVNTVLQGAWATVLSGVAGCDDVVFGATVAGRPAGLPDIDGVVGAFVNTLPVRVRSWSGDTAAWLQALQNAQAEASEFEWMPMPRIQACVPLQGSRRLFDSLVVFENYPWERVHTPLACGLRMTDVTGGVATALPVMLVVLPGERMTLRLVLDRQRFDGAAGRWLLDAVQRVLVGLVADATPAAARAGVGAPPVAGSAAHARERVDAAQPRSALEQRLVTLWQDLLAVHPVGIHDDFFALGGHSLTAVRLCAALQSELGLTMPLGRLFAARTVAQLAATLERPGTETPGAESLLVALQPHGDRPPLFAVGGVGGMVFRCVPLARHIGDDQPVFGLHAQGVDSRQPIQERVEDMAATYIAEIRKAHPSGPYHLAGFSLGGAIALEMAQQLVAAGLEVGLLGMFDAGPPNRPDHGGRQVAGFANMVWNVPRWCLDTLSRSRGDLFGALRGRLPEWRNALTARWRRNGTVSPLRAEQVVDLAEWPDRAREVAEVHFKAYLAYRAHPYRGHVSVFRAKRQPLGRLFVDDLGWRALAEGGVTVYPVPGRHMTIMEEPYAAALAAAVRRALDEAARTEGRRDG